MSPKTPTFPLALLGPLLAATAAVSLVPGYPAWGWVAVLVAAGARLALTLRGRQPPSLRFATALWVYGPSVVTMYAFVVAQRDRDPVPAILSAGTSIAAICLLSPTSALGLLRLLALSAALVAAGALASPSAAMVLAVLVYTATLIPAVLSVEARFDPVVTDDGEGAVRRVRVAGPRAHGVASRSRASGLRAAVLLLAFGFPFGLGLFATLPMRHDDSGERASLRPGDDGEGPGRAGSGLPGFLPNDAPVGGALTGLRTGRRSGYHATLTQSQVVALRVRVDEGVRGPSPFWMRSAGFDVFDGREWQRSRAVTEQVPAPQARGWTEVGRRDVPGRRWSLHVIDVLGGSAGAIALMPDVERVRWSEESPGEPLRVEKDGTVSSIASRAPGSSYEQDAWVPDLERRELLGRKSDAATSPLPGYTMLSGQEVEAYRKLARTVVGTATDAAVQAQRIELWLRGSEFSYALAGLDLDPRRPVADFLFRSRRGHCWCFASSMALMMRALGHPARMALGFRGGDFLETVGERTFRGSDAHAWTEVFFEGAGWVIYDPTPAAAEHLTRSGRPSFEEDQGSLLDRLSRFSGRDRQRWLSDALKGARKVLPAAVLALLPYLATVLGAGAILLLVRRRRRSALGPAADFERIASGPYRKALLALASLGVPRRDPETPDEFSRRASSVLTPAASPLKGLTGWHVRVRYGEALSSPEDERRAALESAAIVEAAKAARRS